MSDKTHIYCITDLDADPLVHRLVRAPNAAQAQRYVVGRRFVTDLATQETLVALTSEGVKVETIPQLINGDSKTP